MKKVVTIAFALVISLSLLVSGVSVAIAADVDTTVNVTGGTTTPPIIKCKWEQDSTINLEDGDPTHLISGSQFLPSGVYQEVKVVQYWVVVTDPEGVSTVDTVSVDVYHPAGCPEEGSFKYQVILHKVDRLTVGWPAFLAADDAGLITYNTGYDLGEVDFELDKATAEVYMGQQDIHYCQPCGDYLVKANACDQGNSWAQPLENYFTYVCVPGFEVDFNALNYGDVTVSNNKWIAGDTVFNSPIAAAPVPNKATVRNIGNTEIKMTVEQTDMNFGFSGIIPTQYQGSVAPTEEETNWNVVFDARLGSDQANGMYYDPLVVVTLPNSLPLCNTEEFDFSIHIIKSMAGIHSGTQTLGCVEVPFSCPES